jgi:hypothetical protein
MKKNLILALVFTGILACNNNRKKMADRIAAMEKNNGEYSKQYLDSLTTMYENYAQAYPEDSLSPKYLLKAATNAQTMASFDMKYIDIALGKYETVVTRYEDHKEASTALFMMGTIYENLKGDTTKARELYTRYITKYPHGEYAEDVNALLNGSLGKSAEELYEEFKKNGKIDTSDVNNNPKH